MQKHLPTYYRFHLHFCVNLIGEYFLEKKVIKKACIHSNYFPSFKNKEGVFMLLLHW